MEWIRDFLVAVIAAIASFFGLGSVPVEIAPMEVETFAPLATPLRNESIKSSIVDSVTFVNTKYNYQITYPSVLAIEAVGYAPPEDPSEESWVAVGGVIHKGFNINALDPAHYPSSATLSLREYVIAVHAVNDDKEASAIVPITLGGKEAYLFSTEGGFNSYDEDRDGSGWVAYSKQNHIYVKTGTSVLSIWYPADMVEADSILKSFSFK